MKPPMTRPGEDPVLTASQAATMFGVAVQTVHQWVEKGLLEAWRTPGGHRRILKKSAMSLLDQRVESPRRTGDNDPFHLLVVEDDARMAMTYKMHLVGHRHPGIVLHHKEMKRIVITCSSRAFNSLIKQ